MIKKHENKEGKNPMDFFLWIFLFKKLLLYKKL